MDFDDSVGDEDRGSVFHRLGGVSGGGDAPPPASYAGGASRPPLKGEESWFKVTVSMSPLPLNEVVNVMVADAWPQFLNRYR